MFFFLFLRTFFFQFTLKDGDVTLLFIVSDEVITNDKNQLLDLKFLHKINILRGKALH